MATLDARLTELERTLLPQPTRTAVQFPDESGRYPEPPAGAAKVIRVEFVEVAHADT